MVAALSRRRNGFETRMPYQLEHKNQRVAGNCAYRDDALPSRDCGKLFESVSDKLSFFSKKWLTLLHVMLCITHNATH